MPAPLELRGVAKSYGGREVLRPTDLTVAEGRTLALIGPSGCGKSTLLRLMIGLALPDRGEVLFRGERLAPESLVATRRRMGYVLQDGGLFPHLTAAGNAALLARHVGWPDARVRARLAELAAMVHLADDALARYPAELSGGQRQRVSLVRALMLEPEVLLLDEPLGALDPMIRAELQDELRAVFRRLGTTVVLVTHDMAEAAFFGDRIALLRDGAIVQEGTFDELARAPAEPFVTRFVSAHRALSLGAGGDA
jgi:osmoprotectant transport system ATP-binding protein